ncbi:MAG: N-formylglutamate amidohydrolase [Rhodomicrobiaceae bacterium]
MLAKLGRYFRKMQDIEAQSIETELNPPFTVLKPEHTPTPFIFNSPHSGRTYPSVFLNASRLTAAALRKSEDAYVDLLLAGVVNIGATLMHAHFPRAYLDVNREPYELDPALFAETLPDYANTHSLRVVGGLGTIARVVNEQEEIYRAPLAITSALERINRLYKPYHGTLSGILHDARDQFGYAVLIDFHSMPSYQGDRANAQKVDFVLGDRFGTSCQREMVRVTERFLSGLGYRVALNKPYAGGYITERYGLPSEGLHTLQIEVNRALYMDEETLALRRDFRNLRANLTSLASTVVQTLPAYLAPRRTAAE